MILAGYNVHAEKPSIHWIDYLASMAEVPFAAHGYGALFTMSIFDRYHKNDLSEEDAMTILRKCFAEVEHRMAVNLKGFLVKKVSKNGVEEVPFSL